jgi:TonB family protein
MGWFRAISLFGRPEQSALRECAMSTVVKENKILTSIPETATAQPVASSTAAPTPDASARPQPVALEVAVTVNGARTVAGSDKREPFSESTKTVLIYGHGAVVRLTSSVAPGQLLFLTNEKTKKEVVCQVVKSKNYHHVSGYVELEFTEQVAGFWGMRFPAHGTAQSSPTLAAPAASRVKPVSAPALPPTAQKTPTSSPAIESRPASSTPAASTKVSLPDAKFAAPTSPSTPTPAPTTPSASSSQPSALSQQNARATSTPAAVTPSTYSINSNVSENTKPSKVVEISRTRPAGTEEHIASTKLSTASSKSILDSDEVKMPSWLEPLARNAAASSAAAEADAKEQLKHHHDVLEQPDLAITEISAVPEAANTAVAAPSFGSRLLTDEFDTLSTNTGSSSKKGLVIGIAAGLLLLIGGGAWYMRQTAGGPQAQVAAPAQNTVAENSNALQTSQASQVSVPTQSNPSSAATSVAAAAGTAVASSGNASGSASSLPEPVNASLKTKDVVTNVAANAAPGVAPGASAPRAKKPKLGEVNLSAPIVNSATGGQTMAEEGLNLEASNQVGSAGNLSSGLSVSNVKQPVAPPVPLPVGGDVKAARLISSVPPSYPAIAKSQRVGGNVKIDAVVDATGRVTGMTIVSGPTLLQQSAMEALRHWKYEPAQLDGKAVATHLTVTIQFKLQ